MNLWSLQSHSSTSRVTFNLLEFYSRRLVRMLPLYIVKHLIEHAYMGYIQSPTQRVVNFHPFATFKDWFDDFSQNNWYIKTDLILYFLSPLLLFPLKRYGYKFVPVILLLSIGSAVYNHSTLEEYVFESRCNPWLFGLVVAFVIFHENGMQRKLSPGYVSFSWRVLLLCIYCHIRMNNYGTQLTYTIFRKFISPLAISWVAYVLIKGHLSKLANFLSHPVFQFLSKSTLSAFLVHILIINAVRADQQHVPLYISKLQVFNGLMGTFMMTLIIANIFTLFFELPFINLHRESTKMGLSRRIRLVSLKTAWKEVVEFLQKIIRKTSHQNKV